MGHDVRNASATDARRRDPIPADAGIGLRFAHHREVVATHPAVAWLEVHAENYFGGGAPLRFLDDVRRDYPVALHAVGTSLGSADGVDARHLDRLAQLVARVEPGLVSDHLAWSVVDGNYLADLLPLPLTEEALAVVCRNVEQVQDRLRRRILVENASTCLGYAHATIAEPEFLAALAARTGCGILCDVNNAYVSAANHGFDAAAWIDALPPAAVGEIHLAGHAMRVHGDGTTLRIDDHGSPVAHAVWTLYAHALARFGPVPTLVEWDTNLPPLAVLLAEAARAAQAIERTRMHDALAA
jgi:uncharacterized protein (UPF0276 family)